MAIASHASDLWIANVYFGVDDDFNIYFIGSDKTKNNQQIEKNPQVAFSTIWFDENDHANRKGVQGVGTCTVATDGPDIAKGIALHNLNYPEFRERITVEWIGSNEYGSKVWIIKPQFIKFWNDELYGDDESEDFGF